MVLGAAVIDQETQAVEESIKIRLILAYLAVTKCNRNWVPLRYPLAAVEPPERSIIKKILIFIYNIYSRYVY